MPSTAQLYAVSRATLYRLLRGDRRPKDAHREDRGRLRFMPAPEIERWCEITAAMKLQNHQQEGPPSLDGADPAAAGRGRRGHAGRLPEPRTGGRLTASTLNRHPKRLGYDQERMTRQPPAVRFQAEQSNALRHFDMSPSDLKHLKAPPWLDPDRAGALTLMLFSVVDNWSGVAHQEHRCVYGENVEAALRLLFNAMSPHTNDP